MIHVAEICAGYVCACVGVHMCIVYRQWSDSAQLFIQGFHGDMLHNTTAGDYRVYMTLRNVVFPSVLDNENRLCLGCMHACRYKQYAGGEISDLLEKLGRI